MKKSLFIGLTLMLFSCESENKDALVTISTEFGDIIIILHDETPKHKSNFVDLATQGFYDGTTFHRVIDNFMIQGGDPNSKDTDIGNDGLGGAGYFIPAEFNSTLTHKFGALAAARLSDSVNPSKSSNGSQFYIVNNPSGAGFLDNDYTVFGQTIVGFDVIKKISVQAKGHSDRPLKDIKMKVSLEELTSEEISNKYNYNYDVE